jgi:Ca2+-transporting ATPase
MTGSGKAVVLAVGKRLRYETENLVKEDDSLDVKETTLQKRLTTLGNIIRIRAYILVFICLLVLSIYYFGMILSTEEMKLYSSYSFHRCMNTMIICVTLLIVIVPEGLPLAVSITAAFSTNYLRSDNVLIKKLQAVENCGQMTDVITSKTSTLTTGDLTVRTVYTG